VLRPVQFEPNQSCWEPSTYRGKEEPSLGSVEQVFGHKDTIGKSDIYPITTDNQINMTPHADTAVSSSTSASSSSQTQAQGKNNTVKLPVKQTTTTTGSISATVSGRQWIMGQEAFERKMPHHEGIKALWETKWRFPCSKSLYPFHDGKYEDFEPIFNFLIEVRIPSPILPCSLY
jgi:hypothetical protein